MAVFIDKTKMEKGMTIRDKFGSEEHRDWALSLFNAVEDTDYDNPDDLIFVTLDNAVYKTRRAEPPMLELTVIRYNINGNNNPKLKRKCPQLMEYVWFTDEIRRNGEYMTMDAAIDDMPENFTIKEYLEVYRSEVIGMCLAEYDEEEHISSEKEISFKKGVIQSKASLIQRQMKKGLTNINEEVPFFLRSVKKGMNSYRKYGIINSVVRSQNDKYFA